MLVPVQLSKPDDVTPQCVEPSVKVGVLVDLRQNASPVDVSCSVSPVPFGSAYSHDTGSPIALPTRDFSVAKPNTNCGNWPGSQWGALCAQAMGARADTAITATAAKDRNFCAVFTASAFDEDDCGSV